jgi:HEAT repeat protein
VAMSSKESDEDVCSSIAQTLGFTRDPIAIPVLLRMSSHDHDDVRVQVARALPSCCDDDHPNDPNVVGTLVSLMNDSCVEVRDNATFGLARMLEADSKEIRDALADRLTDTDWETRREGLIGLARRRDTRAIKPILEALRAGDTDRLVLDAVRYVASEQFLPHLMALGSDDEFTEIQILNARKSCDPMEVAYFNASILEFLTDLQDALTREEFDVRVGLSSRRFEFDITLDIESQKADQGKWSWSFEDLLRRSDDSLTNAVANVLEDIKVSCKESSGP